MKLTALISGLFATVVAMLVSVSANATVPFTEDFTTTANWSISTNTADPLVAPTFNSSGGPDNSSYISRTAPTLNSSGAIVRSILFRAQDEYDSNNGSSNGQFEGNWIADGINRFSMFVRHSAPDPLSYFVRFATPSNSPAVSGEGFFSVQPNTWTKLSIDILTSNIKTSVADLDHQLTVEGPPAFFNSTFSNVGHIQVGVSLPANSGAAGPFVFDLDKASIGVVPEPATCLLTMAGAVFMMASRRRRAR